jgi:HSP20 family protein
MYGFTIFDTIDNLLKNELEMSSSFTNLSTQRVYSEDNTLVFELALPGFSKKEINVDAVGRTLTIQSKIDKEDETYFKKSFKKTYTIPSQINPEDIKASMENGILTLKMGKAESVKKVTIL